jgi:hypothetical protein
MRLPFELLLDLETIISRLRSTGCAPIALCAVARTVGSAHRLELLELLAQTERSDRSEL